MKTQSILVLATLLFCLLVPIKGLASPIRLYEEHCLDIGNRWDYQQYITLWDNTPINQWYTGTMEITGTADVAGITTTVIRTTSSHDGATAHDYVVMGDDFITEYAFDGDNGNIYGIFRNNNPLEAYPIWIDTTDNERAFGWGDFDLYYYQPQYFEMMCSMETFVTYIGNQNITVPAGTFDCIVATIEQKIEFSIGLSGTVMSTLYYDPSIGTIKCDVEETLTIPGQPDSRWIYFSELTSTNVPEPATLLLLALGGLALRNRKK